MVIMKYASFDSVGRPKSIGFREFDRVRPFNFVVFVFRVQSTTATG